MKRLGALVSCLLAAVLVLSACGTGSGARDQALTIWATNVNVPILQKAAELYAKDHPGFKLNVVEMANDDIRSKVTIGLQAKGQGLPDAALLVDDGIHGYLEKFPDVFVNLSSKGFDEYRSQFPDYKVDSVSLNGDMYAFPFDAGPVGVFYRTDLFEQAGVDASSIHTWADYIEAGKKIKQATGASMLSYDSTDSTVFTILLSQQGLGYFDEQGHATLGTAQGQNVASLFSNLKKNGLLIGSPGWNAWVTSLSSSQSATAITGAWLIGTLQQQLPDQSGKWGVMPLPAFEEGGSQSANQGGSSFVISRTSPRADEAYEFLKYFTTNFDMQELAMEGGLFPSYLPTYESKLFSEPVEYFAGKPVWTFFADEMSKIPSVLYTANDIFARNEAIKVQAEVTNGMDPAASLQGAATRIENRVQ